MDLLEIQKRKDDLELSILELVNKYEKETFTDVVDIKVDKTEITCFGDGYHHYLNRIEVEITLRLKLQ